jgi:hypothetical protein
MRERRASAKGRTCADDGGCSILRVSAHTAAYRGAALTVPD